MALKLLLILVSVPVMLFVALFVFISATGKRPVFTYLPKTLPPGITMQKMLVAFSTGGYGSTYTYNGKNSITFIEGDRKPLSCNRPNTSAITEYAEFRPAESDVGCMMTVDKDGLRGRVYMWKSGIKQFGITSVDPSLKDDTVMQIANSVESKTLLINTNAPTKLQDGSTVYFIVD